ncbi:hypothetical protein IM751_00105 [Moraxella sp. K1630]|nr:MULTISPECIES: hypothetical protein [unclassified Moraxella]MBE9586995.1 hypothetical protein [Moraxella sp. K1630]MBE9595233.1 hypothetical protein [Moraxella sp. K2450]
MNYNRPIIITLLAVLSLCVSTLARAEPAPVLPTTPPPANDPIYPTPTNPPPGGLPTTAPNDPKPPSKKPPSKWGKVKDNLKKIAKPNPYEIGVELGIMGLGALVDHLLDPANNAPQKYPVNGCGHSHMYGDIRMGKGKPFDWYPSLVCEDRGQTYTVLYKSPLGKIGTSYRMQCANGFEFFNVCYDYDVIKPQPQPQPQPSPNPAPAPAPAVEPQPSPSPSPAPEPQPKPSPQPSPSPNDKPQDETKPFELPEFCKWASWFCEGDLDKKDTDIDIDEMPIPTNSINISFGGSCPTPKIFHFPLVVAPWYFLCLLIHFVKLQLHLAALLKSYQQSSPLIF